jgi:hypothetical protein
MEIFMNPNEMKLNRWTLLVLSPKEVDESGKLRHPRSRILWENVVDFISIFMDLAHRSSVKLGDELVDLLAFDDREKLLYEDAKFSQTQKLFWMINIVDEVVPMMKDAVEQWE